MRILAIAVLTCFLSPVAKATNSSTSQEDLADVSGKWSGATRCPLGPSTLDVDIKGKAGTFRQSYPSGTPAPFDTPITIRYMSGHQGLWVYLETKESGPYHSTSGLLSVDGSAIAMGGMGNCEDYVLTRTTSPTAQASAGHAPLGAFAPSKTGPPNGDAIVQAMTNEWVAFNGTRLGDRRVRAVHGLGVVDLTFEPAQDLSCREAGAAVYDCSFTHKVQMDFSPTTHAFGESPLMKILEPFIQKALDAPPRIISHRFELGRDGWRSSTYRRGLIERATQQSEDDLY